MTRDYNGMRGPVPTGYRAHDWQTCRVLREIAERWRNRRLWGFDERPVDVAGRVRL